MSRDTRMWSAPIWYTSGYIRDPAVDLHPVSVQREGYSGPDFSGLSWLCNHSKGDKSPKELCGLWSAPNISTIGVLTPFYRIRS